MPMSGTLGATEVAPTAPCGSCCTSTTDRRLRFHEDRWLSPLGAEVITILPFLTLPTRFTRHHGTGRKTASLSARLLSALFFGLLYRLPATGI